MRNIALFFSALILIGVGAQKTLGQEQARGVIRGPAPTTEPSGLPEAGRRFALCIGINNYNTDSGYPVLRYAVADAKSLGGIFAALGYRTIIMTDDGEGLSKDGKRDSTLVPTSVNIIRELQDFARNAKNPDDELVISYAGHGDIIENQSAIVPIDYSKSLSNLVTISRILDPLNDPQCRARSKLLLLDACHSGKANKAFFLSFVHEKSLMIFSACSAGQSSMEDEDLGHGRFTEALMWGLVGKGFKVPTIEPGGDANAADWHGEAYENGSDFLSARQLSDYVGRKFSEKHWVGKASSHPDVSDDNDPDGQNPRTFGEEDASVPMIVGRRKVTDPQPLTSEDTAIMSDIMDKANYAYAKRDWVVMIHYATTALRIKSDNAAALALRAMGNLHATYLKQADDDAKFALQSDPDQAEAMQVRGMAAAARGDKNSAREFLNKAQRLIDANPKKWKSIATGEEATYRHLAMGMVSDDGKSGVAVLASEAQKPDLPPDTLGDVAAIIGRKYEEGSEVPQDKAQALKWFLEGSRAGNSAATLHAGMLYEEKQDYRNAMTMYMKAQEAGQEKAMYKIASLYENGHGVTQDFAQAMKWYRKAAEVGNSDAMNRTGWMIQNGLGFDKPDAVEAMHWYLKAVDGRNEMAMENIGQLYLLGHGVTQNNETALWWFRKGAELGSAEATGSVGYMYDQGFGVKRDYAEAMNWYQTASNEGNAVAMLNIGNMYQLGHGVPQSYERAMYWYRKSAEKVNSDAMDHIAVLYENGWGVVKSYDRARESYSNAAQWGNEHAIKWMAAHAGK